MRCASMSHGEARWPRVFPVDGSDLPQAARRGRIGLECTGSDRESCCSQPLVDAQVAEAFVRAGMEGSRSVLQGKTYDAIIIGTSWGDRLLPMAFAQAGRNVALVERGHLGGTCVNTGCTPTKTMVASARVAYLARRGANYGVHTGPIAVAMLEVRQRKQGIVEGARSRVESLINEVDLLQGRHISSRPGRLRSSSRSCAPTCWSTVVPARGIASSPTRSSLIPSLDEWA